MKLWDKGYSIDQDIEDFTVGKDRELDLQLATYDIIGSKAHADMLTHIGMISSTENQALQKELDNIQESVSQGEFEIAEGVEDVHSQIEMLLTLKLGDVGKKIHLGRSRNDQVLLDLRLFFRDALKSIAEDLGGLVATLLNAADAHASILIPGYTHMQIGMVSSWGLWFGGFAEGLIDDLSYAIATRDVINRNPLGTAAGYGSSIPVDRNMTTTAMEFNGLCVNPINAQLGRGKTELQVAQAVATIALTINKLAMDLCLFSNENYGFLSLPIEYTTGSSIMPHKKNPDVFELIRAKTNLLTTLPTQILSMITNLTSGYHRDFQLQKEILMPAIMELKRIITLVHHCVPQLIIHPTQIHDEKYRYVWSVEVVNELVRSGMPFRDAYQKVGLEIEAGSFEPSTELNHTHIGSIGNLSLDVMRDRMRSLLSKVET